MKLNVLTDPSGRIIAAHLASPTLPLPPPAHPSSTAIRPRDGQSLHTVELPPDLEPHALRDTLFEQLKRWKIEGRGKSAKLVKD